MIAEELMVRQVIKVKETDRIQTVLEKFVAHRISGMPVVNEANVVVGFISDGDIMRWIGKQEPVVIDLFLFIGTILDQSDLESKFKGMIHRNVMDVATQKVTLVSTDMEIDEIASILGKRRIKKVPVIKKGVLAGIISRGDIIRYISKFYLDLA